MITFFIIFGILYLIITTIMIFGKVDSSGDDIVLDILILYSPLNVIFTIAVILFVIYSVFSKKFLLKMERKRKIRRGIIRITPDDPYGEEDWS